MQMLEKVPTPMFTSSPRSFQGLRDPGKTWDFRLFFAPDSAQLDADMVWHYIHVRAIIQQRLALESLSHRCSGVPV